MKVLSRKLRVKLKVVLSYRPRWGGGGGTGAYLLRMRGPFNNAEVLTFWICLFLRKLFSGCPPFFSKLFLDRVLGTVSTVVIFKECREFSPVSRSFC